jgi:hypothetical protein
MNLTALQTAIRNYLGDNSAVPTLITWADAQLTVWINAAIAVYSIDFPMHMDNSVDASAGVSPYNVHGILSVEYQPLGVSNDPPTWYSRHDYRLPDFYSTNDVYDWRRNDTSDAATMPPVLILNPPTPNDADVYFVQYNGDHPQLTLGADVLTVPTRHINLIYLYVRWLAIQELSTGVKRATYFGPGGGGTLQQPYSEIDLKRTLEAYQSAVRSALKAESESVQIHWKMDKYDRIT